MKKWLKKHSKWLVVGLGVLFISNSICGIITTDTEWKVIGHICVIVLGLVIILLVFGIIEKFAEWWDKD